MRFVLTMDTDNDAFADGALPEVARILTDVARRVGEGSSAGTCRDINGNTVGEFTFTAAGQ